MHPASRMQDAFYVKIFAEIADYVKFIVCLCR